MQSEIRKQMQIIKRMKFDISNGEKYLKETEKLKAMSEDCSEEDKEYISKELLKHLDHSLNDMNDAILAYKIQTDAPIISIGENRYDLREYATITQYAKLFGYKSTQAISNKIARGVIPKDDILTIQSLDLKLIRLP